VQPSSLKQGAKSKMAVFEFFRLTINQTAVVLSGRRNGRQKRWGNGYCSSYVSSALKCFDASSAYKYPNNLTNMHSKVFSAVLILLAQSFTASAGPIDIICNSTDPYIPPCPSGFYCCLGVITDPPHPGRCIPTTEFCPLET